MYYTLDQVIFLASEWGAQSKDGQVIFLLKQVTWGIKCSREGNRRYNRYYTWIKSNQMYTPHHIIKMTGQNGCLQQSFVKTILKSKTTQGSPFFGYNYLQSEKTSSKQASQFTSEYHQRPFGEQSPIKPVMRLVPFTTSLIQAHNLERIPIDHCDNKLSPGPNCPHPPSLKSLEKGCQSVRIWEGVRVPQIPPKRENAPPPKLIGSARMPEKTPSPQTLNIHANIAESTLPTHTAAVRLTGIDGEIQDLAEIFNAVEMIWDTGAHGTIVSEDMLSPEFRKYLTHSIHDSYRTNMQEYRLMGECVFLIQSYGSIVSASLLSEIGNYREALRGHEKT